MTKTFFWRCPGFFPGQGAGWPALLLVLVLVLVPLSPGLWAEEHGGGGKPNVAMVKMTVMVPILEEKTHTMRNIMPIGVDLAMEDPLLQQEVAGMIPRLQDACYVGTYGKVTTTTGYEKIEQILLKQLESILGAEKAQHIHISIRLNVKPG